MPKQNNISIGKRIALIRGRLTQAEFGEIIGVGAATISKYESGRVPKTYILAKIAEFGNVTVDWILEGKGNAPQSYIAKRERQASNNIAQTKEEAPRLDEKLLTDIIIMLEEVLAELGVHLVPAKKGSLVVHIYRRYAETALPVSKGTVRSYIDLVL